MPWIQLKLNTTGANAEELSDALMEAGAVSITFQDTHNTPVFEPLPGETRLWGDTDVIGLFDAETDMKDVVAILEQHPLLGAGFAHKIEQLEDKDWEREWMDNFHPMRFGERLWICPSWRDIPEWRQALVYLREVGWTEGQKGGYNGECNPDVWQGQTWPCGKDKDGDFLSYFGRGAKQLSYNYNYGPFSDAMYGDVRPLLDKPELVADTWMNLASAVFFFVYPQPPKPSMLHVIDGTWQPNDRDKANGLVSGFGVTIQIINGGVECGGADENAQSLNRIAYYKEFANYLKVPVPADEVLGCKKMKQFDEGGAGALPIYWEQDWGWSADTADGKTYSCQLVGYQTPYTAFKEGDYTKCVQHYFNVNVVDDNGTTEPDVTPTPAPVTDENVAPVARIAGPVGAVEAGSPVSLSAEGSTDANGDKLTYTWMSQDGKTLSGQDKAVVIFNAPDVTQNTQYVVNLTVSDGTLSSTAVYTLNVKAKAAAADDEDKTTSYPAWSSSQKWNPGDIVNSNGALYQCKPFPEGSWCNVAPAYYEPGVGIAWADAWNAL
ncbi:chitinase [Salmonella enterica subsp. enterica serovar Dublin]|nr:chitinase [Salmonella enterica subsp. enterica serovar Dublin]